MTQEPFDFNAALRVAKTAGQEGMQAALEHAEAEDASFGEKARAFIVAYLREHGATSGEIVTNAAKRAGIVPPDDRSFGGVYQGLRRRGLIRFVAYCERFKGHGTGGGRIWEAA